MAGHKPVAAWRRDAQLVACSGRTARRRAVGPRTIDTPSPFSAAHPRRTPLSSAPGRLVSRAGIDHAMGFETLVMPPVAAALRRKGTRRRRSAISRVTSWPALSTRRPSNLAWRIWRPAAIQNSPPPHCGLTHVLRPRLAVQRLLFGVPAGELGFVHLPLHKRASVVVVPGCPAGPTRPRSPFSAGACTPRSGADSSS